MKVGTDGVLLGSWARLNNAMRILDIGTGSGLIALMLAQRSSGTEAVVDALEIEREAASQASENFLLSPWRSKLSIHLTSLQDYQTPYVYDLIVSNPPYFKQSQPSPDTLRQQTRHTSSLDHETLIHHVKRLLGSGGRFNVILPYSEGNAFVVKARLQGLFCSRVASFRTRPEKAIERWLYEFALEPMSQLQEEILLYKAELEWSDEYRELTQDFYLASQ